MLLKAWQFAAISSFLAGALAHPTERHSSVSARQDAPVEEAPADAPVDEVAALRDDSDRWDSPEYTLLYRSPLPIPPVKQPKLKLTNPVSGAPIHYYEIEIKPFEQRVYPTLRPAKFVGYDGIAPGPTFITPVGTETVVRFINRADKENSVHLHGSPSRAPFDGWAEDVTFPGEYKDYYWPNYQSARMLWYHDHAAHITAENAYLGQAGVYLLHDPAEDALGLPSGYGEFDIPIVLTSRYYNEDGTLRSTDTEDQNFWGDVIHVNGQAWPFFNVQPRKYRLRFLNAAVSRAWFLYFVRTNSPNARIPFQVIATDAGLTERPITTQQMYLSIAERYEIVIDFTNYRGQTIDLRNVAETNDVGDEDEYAHTLEVMRFIVSSTPVQDNSVVPATLRHFERSNGQYQINDVAFADVNNRVLAKPALGSVEIWELENSSGGWSHPVHIHLIDFKVLRRTGGRNAVMPYESAGLKDVVWLGRGETLTVEAHYQPWTGAYMFHCHNLIHEDNDMMAVFNVTAMEEKGYVQEDFEDPLNPKWRARPYTLSDVTARTGPFSDEAITARIMELAREEPYNRLDEIRADLGIEE
ncbi:phenol oxidase A [Stachybotrys elegans]|uniref:Phenol oxidase A n=1 Tax=Stachybotrys elegans TaxID=80388 RepID=A0A8K0SJG5_9HYPO|nr:phenol oxidase A [Stachybotrys elegans]